MQKSKVKKFVFPSDEKRNFWYLGANNDGTLEAYMELCDSLIIPGTKTIIWWEYDRVATHWIESRAIHFEDLKKVVQLIQEEISCPDNLKNLKF